MVRNTVFKMEFTFFETPYVFQKKAFDNRNLYQIFSIAFLNVQIRRFSERFNLSISSIFT